MGGRNAANNLQLAHRVCNIKKAGRIPDGNFALSMQGFVKAALAKLGIEVTKEQLYAARNRTEVVITGVKFRKQPKSSKPGFLQRWEDDGGQYNRTSFSTD